VTEEHGRDQLEQYRNRVQQAVTVGQVVDALDRAEHVAEELGLGPRPVHGFRADAYAVLQRLTESL